MKPKYLICPGSVVSKTDGQTHYIGPMQLMRLYDVDPRECEIHEPAPWWPRSYYMAAEERQRGLPRLGPRYDGNYELHNDKAQGAGGGLIAGGSAGTTGSTTRGQG